MMEPYHPSHVEAGYFIPIRNKTPIPFQPRVDINTPGLIKDVSTTETMHRNSVTCSKRKYENCTGYKVKTWSCCGINPHTGLTCNTNNDIEYQ